MYLFFHNLFHFRAMPSVNIDASTKKTHVTNIQCELYIHERSKRKASETPARRHKAQKLAANGGRGLENGEEEGVALMDTSEVKEEKSKFVIVGAIDPRSQQEISVYQAINKVWYSLSLKKCTLFHR